MASVNVIHRLSKPKKDGSFPLYLQVINNRKPSEMSLKLSLQAEEWDSTKQLVKRKNPRYKALNSQIRNIKLKIDEIIHNLEMSNQSYVGLDVIQLYKIPITTESLDTNLCEFLTAHVISNPENLQINSLKAYSNLISCLSNYAPNLLFSELNDDFLFAYEKHLQSIGKATNTIS
ncbi:MAG: Arm DNA-binding domain-containing protein, partial [Saprospiraceae bacterium]